MVHITLVHSFNTTWHNCLTSSIMLGLRANFYSFWSSVWVESPQIQLAMNITELLEWPALWFLDQICCSRETNTILQLASETAIVSMIPCLLPQLPHPLRYCSKYTQIPRGRSLVILAVLSIILPFPPPFSGSQTSIQLALHKLQPFLYYLCVCKVECKRSLTAEGSGGHPQTHAYW